jgi:hypothetical protein
MPTVLTKQSKQRRMMQFYNDISQHNMVYLAVGYSNQWINTLVVPIETDSLDTYGTQLLGYQTFKEILFARPITNPTEEQRDTCIYYKEVYYDTISDFQRALDEGYTRIMMRFVLDKDEYFPVFMGDGAAMYNVLGMYINVNPGDLSDTYFISPNDFNTRVTNKGTLELISTRSIISRSADQAEDVVILLEF